MSAATLFASPFASIQDANGDPIVGAKISVFITGTTTPQPVYHDSGLSTEWTQPITTNSAGQSDGPIFVASSPSLKLVVTTSADVPVPGYPMEPWTPYALADGSSSDGFPASWGLFNIKDYGALGDGVTDDTAAIQATLDAAAAVGGTVIIPPSDEAYVITATLIVGNNNLTGGPKYVSIRGASPVRSVLEWQGPVSGSLAIALKVTYNKGFRFEGFRVVRQNYADGMYGDSVGILQTGPLTTGLQDTNGEWDRVSVAGFFNGMQVGEFTGHASGEMTYRNFAVEYCGTGVYFADLNTLNHYFLLFQASYCTAAMNMTIGTVWVNGFSIGHNDTDFVCSGSAGTMTIANGRTEESRRFLTTPENGGNGVIVVDSIVAGASSDVDGILIECFAFTTISIRSSLVSGYLVVTAPASSQNSFLDLTGSVVWAAPGTDRPWAVGVSSYDDTNGLRVRSVGNFIMDPNDSGGAIIGAFPDIESGYWSNGNFHPRLAFQQTGSHTSATPITTVSGITLQDVRSLQYGTTWVNNSAGAAVQTGTNLRIRATFATSNLISFTFERALMVDVTTGSSYLAVNTGGPLTLADVGSQIVITDGAAGGDDLTTVINFIENSGANAYINAIAGATDTLAAVVGQDEPDRDYLVVGLCGNAEETFWVTDLDRTGFHIHSSNATSTATVSAMIVR